MQFIMKLISMLILALSFYFFAASAKSQEDSVKEIIVVTEDVSSDDIEQIISGVSSRSVRADVGKFLLLKSDRQNVALKIIKLTRLSKNKAHYYGAEYECYLCDSEKCLISDRYEGEVFEPEGGGIADNIFIKCGKIKIEWSKSNWIYYSESINAISRTELTAIEDIKITDKQLKWYYRDKKKPE